MELRDDAETIPQFYKRKSIFITGFSGFLGKALVEKLLRCCPDIEKIYVLMREKKGVSVQKRMEEIFKLPLFEKLSKSDWDKVEAVEGDNRLPELGITPPKLREMYDCVSVIFHASASVRFDDPLIDAIDVNTRSTKSIVDIAKNMKNFSCLVHVSTAYTNCDKKKIEEKMYPPQADWKVSLALKDNFDPALIEILSQKYTNGMPNTYVFAKSLAEHIIADHSSQVRSIIFRPSIVVSTFKEPIPGWIDNMNGPVGLLAGYGSGVVRTSICNDSIMPDYMPLDIAIRALVAAPWSVANLREYSDFTIFNCCSSHRSISTKQMIDMGGIIKDKYPMKMMMWRPVNHISRTKFWFTINVYLFHLIPAAALDVVLRLLGRKPMLWRLQRKVYVAMMSLLYFTINQFNFDNSRLLKLNDAIKEEDKEAFFFNLPFFDTMAYFEMCAIGFQKYILKQSESDRPQAVRNLKILTALDITMKTVAAITAIWYTFFISTLPLNVLHAGSRILGF